MVSRTSDATAASRFSQRMSSQRMSSQLQQHQREEDPAVRLIMLEPKAAEWASSVIRHCRECTTAKHKVRPKTLAGAVLWLLQLSADLEAKADCGSTPLHSAAAYGHVEAVKTLVELSADIQAKAGATPLHAAAISGRGHPGGARYVRTADGAAGRLHETLQLRRRGGAGAGAPSEPLHQVAHGAPGELRCQRRRSPPVVSVFPAGGGPAALLLLSRLSWFAGEEPPWSRQMGGQSYVEAHLCEYQGDIRIAAAGRHDVSTATPSTRPSLEHGPCIQLN